ncbi:MAG: hypothetical protein HYW77_03525 [Parcubacteria group bacterium]|nr:hypothetical protein [Parcubacteria group bacterium]
MSGSNGKDFELVQRGVHFRTKELTTVHIRPNANRYDFEQALRKFRQGTAWVKKECGLNGSFESKSQKRRRKKRQNLIRIRKMERRGFFDRQEVDEETPDHLLRKPKKSFRKGRRSVSEKLVSYPRSCNRIKKVHRTKNMIVYRRISYDAVITSSDLIN